MSKPSLIHVADPMCSWCYAFGPELDRIIAETGLEVRIVMGGLFTGDGVVPLDDQMRSYLDETWARVSDISGRPVSFDLIDWPEWTYDTEMSGRAVIAFRDQLPERALEYFDVLQVAFYAENRDLVKPEVVTELAADFDIDIDAFQLVIADPAPFAADMALARKLGALGFPFLVLDTGGEFVPVSAGYNRASRVLATLSVMAR